MGTHRRTFVPQGRGPAGRRPQSRAVSPPDLDARWRRYVAVRYRPRRCAPPPSPSSSSPSPSTCWRSASSCRCCRSWCSRSRAATPRTRPRCYGVFGTVFALDAVPVLAASSGALSDRFGRRPVILLSNVGLGLDYVLMALAPSLSWLFVGRVIVRRIAAASVSIAGRLHRRRDAARAARGELRAARRRVRPRLRRRPGARRARSAASIRGCRSGWRRA